MKRGTRRQSGQRGGLLIEALVAIVICAFGLLGFAGLQARAIAAEFESFQRTQALTLIENITARMNANRANASAYASAGLFGGGALVDCTGLSGVALDLCEWTNLLRGSAETRGGLKVGSMLTARACIVRGAGTTDRYLVAVAWQGINATAAPASTCGQGNAAYPTESLRRVVSSVVCVGSLAGETAGRC